MDIFTNTWVVGIGTAVLSGLILYFIFGIGRQRTKKAAPYVLVLTTTFYDTDAKWIRFDYSITNLGTDIARNVKTYTRIIIKNRLEFQSPISASSVIPPTHALHARSEDPIVLVELCRISNPDNKYIFFVEYDDFSGNRYVVAKSFFYHAEQNLLSTRDEEVPKRV